jgi:hypothetical protein
MYWQVHSFNILLQIDRIAWLRCPLRIKTNTPTADGRLWRFSVCRPCECHNSSYATSDIGEACLNNLRPTCLHISEPSHYTRVGRAKAEVFCRLPLTAEAWVQSQPVCVGCLVDKVALERGGGGSRSISVVSCQYLSSLLHTYKIFNWSTAYAI